MAVNEQGHKGQYSGNSRHSYNHAHTKVTRNNYGATVKDDLAHMHYLKMDIMYDDHHGHSDEKMTADEKHISKLAGDLKYDKEHHGPGKHEKGHLSTPKAAANELGKEVASGVIEGTISSQAGLGRRTKGIIERAGIQNFKPDVNENISDADRLKRGKMSDLNYLHSKQGPMKPLVGDQHELPDHLKEAILAAPGKYEGAAKISPERLEKIAGQLRQASAMHKGQAQKIDNMLKSTK